LSYGGVVKPLFLPSPTTTLVEMWRMFAEQDFLSDVLVSVSRICTGFALSAVLAIPLGLLMGSSRRAEDLLLPIVGFLRYMPATAFIPLAILWFGVGFLEQVILVFISIFFYLVLLVADAVSNVRPSLVETAQTLGASRLRVVVSVMFRGASPDIWNAMRTMFGVGWVMIVVVELVGADTGIGATIIHAQRFLQTPKILGGIVVIGVLSVRRIHID